MSRCNKPLSTYPLFLRAKHPRVLAHAWEGSRLGNSLLIFLNSRNAAILLYKRGNAILILGKSCFCKVQRENDRHDTLRMHFARTIFSERENHHVTTTETHTLASGWHDPSLLACWCVSVCIEAFFQTSSFGHDREAFGGDSCR